ncbi:MAG: hypothetical protein JJU42_08810 [Rhodobacteraceae bacterium]|nr:hypothetical protein [Paracoccaceae bacterium]
MTTRGAWLVVALALALWLPRSAAAETMVHHGPFHFDPAAPGIIHLSGEIDLRAGLSFQRILDASGEARELVLDSGGGLVHVALPIAIEVRRRGLVTRVPEGAGCYSSCTFLWFAGTTRHAGGEIGVHQLASDSGDLEAGQLAIADIVDVLTGFGVPSAVIVRMLQTPSTGIDVLSQDDLRRYGLIAASPAFATVPLRPEAAPPDPAAPDLTPPEPAPPAEPSLAELAAPGPGTAVPRPRPSITEPDADGSETAVLRALPAPPAPGADAPRTPVAARPAPESGPPPEQRAIDFLARNTRDWSRPNDVALSRIAEDYADAVDFYGGPHSHAEVMADKRAFARRWPVRDYELDLSTARADCDAARCVVTGEILWDARSPERGAVSRGRSIIEVTLARAADGFRITAEGGRVIERY